MLIVEDVLIRRNKAKRRVDKYLDSLIAKHSKGAYLDGRVTVSGLSTIIDETLAEVCRLRRENDMLAKHIGGIGRTCAELLRIEAKERTEANFALAFMVNKAATLEAENKELRSGISYLQNERDAAIGDLDADCIICKHRPDKLPQGYDGYQIHTPCKGWQWRGIQPKEGSQ